MTATVQRDKVANLAKLNAQMALKVALRISDPWFQSQALSWVARYTDADSVVVARQAAKAAADCKDAYKRMAVRAWEIAALAERGKTSEARSALMEALGQAADVKPISSLAEALTLLLHAAARIDDRAAKEVFDVLRTQCSADSHWRCKRALNDCLRVLEKVAEPRPFFW